MPDIIKQVFTIAEAKQQAKIYQAATKSMAEHCDRRIEAARKALQRIADLPPPDKLTRPYRQTPQKIAILALKRMKAQISNGE